MPSPSNSGNSLSPPTVTMKRLMRTTMLSAIVGTAVEWYDFYLYATAAAVIFNKIFFPSYSHLIGTLLSYSTFAIGFFVRPLGGIFFGRLGDRIGRKRVLIITLLLMGASTTAMGLLPTYSQVGIWAPILLALLRAVQGFGSGAEYAGAVLMSIEYAPVDKRGLFGAIPYIGVAAGLLLSLGSFSWASNLPPEQFDSWGWRIPFLLSSLVVAFGIMLRSTLHETPVFDLLMRKGQISTSPVRELFKVARREIFCAWGARLGDNSLAYIYESFVIVYATQQLGIAKPRIIGALMASAAAQFITVPFFGWVSDKAGAKASLLGRSAALRVVRLSFLYYAAHSIDAHALHGNLRCFSSCQDHDDVRAKRLVRRNVSFASALHRLYLGA